MRAVSSATGLVPVLLKCRNVLSPRSIRGGSTNHCRHIKAAPREPGVALNRSNAIEALLAFSRLSILLPHFPPPLAVSFFMGGGALFGMFPLTGIYFRCEQDSRNTSCEALDSSRHWSLSLCSRMSHIDNTNNALFTRCGLQDPLIRYVSHHFEPAAVKVAQLTDYATRLKLDHIEDPHESLRWSIVNPSAAASFCLAS